LPLFQIINNIIFILFILPKQGRYELSDSRAEVVNRSPAGSPTTDATVSISESSAEELRRARALFEKPPEQAAHSSSSSAAQPDLTAAEYGGVGALKSRYLANATQNATAGTRPPPRKMTPPRGNNPVSWRFLRKVPIYPLIPMEVQCSQSVMDFRN
jgi:hypothetical protein